VVKNRKQTNYLVYMLKVWLLADSSTLRPAVTLKLGAWSTVFQTYQLLNYTRNSPLLWHLTIHCHVHNNPLLIPALRHIQQSTPSHNLSFRSILILSTHLHLVFKEMPSFLVFQPKYCELPIHAICPTHLILQAMTNQNKSHIIKSPLGF